MNDPLNIKQQARAVVAIAILALAGYGFGSLAAKLVTYLGA